MFGSDNGWHDGADSLYLASLVLPLVGNDGEDLRKVHETLTIALLDTFGGFTSSDAFGCWRDPDTKAIYSDTLVRYDVAIEWEQRFRFHALARKFGRAASQHAVYATFNGIAKVIPCAPTPAPALSPAGWSHVEGGPVGDGIVREKVRATS